MKIKNIIITILMTTILLILGTTVYAETGKINLKEVKLRKNSDNSSTILDIIYEGDEVEILEQKDGWYKIKAVTSLGKVTGYVSKEVVDIQGEILQENPQKTEEVESNNIDETESTEIETENVEMTETTNTTEIKENNQYTLTQEVKVKALPLINSMEKATINGNVTVVEIINDWARIENDSQYGWIRRNVLQKSLTIVENTETEQPQEDQTVETNSTETAPEEKVTEENVPEQTIPEEPEATEINKIGYVSSDGLRVRKGPSTDTEEIHSLSKNSKVQIIGQEGKWYKIDINGKIGYVSAKYISDTKLPETTSRSGSTIKNEEIKEVETTEPKNEETQKVEEKTEETNEEQQTATSGTTGTAVVEYAKKYLGYKYVSGGASPSKGFDCSGFTTYVYKHFGISLNRSSKDQIKNGVAVEKSNLQPGDLVVFNNDANTKIGHVGIYIGDGNFIHASNPKGGVKITTLLSGYYAQRYVGARRVI